MVEARVFRFRKMVYGNIFRKPFSVFSFGILRSNENIFSLTSVLHCTKRLQMLKTFYGKRFQTKQTEPLFVMFGFYVTLYFFILFPFLLFVMFRCYIK
jgi:hypothetical protein